MSAVNKEGSLRTTMRDAKGESFEGGMCLWSARSRRGLGLEMSGKGRLLMIWEGALVRLFDRRRGVTRLFPLVGVDAGAPSVRVVGDGTGGEGG